MRSYLIVDSVHMHILICLRIIHRYLCRLYVGHLRGSGGELWYDWEFGLNCYNSVGMARVVCGGQRWSMVMMDGWMAAIDKKTKSQEAKYPTDSAPSAGVSAADRIAHLLVE